MKGGLIGGSANVLNLSLTSDNASFSDVSRTAFSGFVGGSIGGKFPGVGGAIFGGASGEGVNQLISGNLQGDKLASAAFFSALGQGVSTRLPSSIGEASDFGLGVALNSTTGFLIDNGPSLFEFFVSDPSRVATENQQRRLEFQLENNIFPLPTGPKP